MLKLKVTLNVHTLDYELLSESVARVVVPRFSFFLHHLPLTSDFLESWAYRVRRGVFKF